MQLPTSVTTDAGSDSDDYSHYDDLSDDGQAELEVDVDDLSMVLDNFSIVSDGIESAEQNDKFKLVYEGPSSKIYCVDDPNNELGGCTGSVAIKSLNDEFSDDELVFRLKNEYAISKHLSQCSAVRAALVQKSIDGLPTIVLEWANGITLGEWMKLLHNKKGTLSESDLSIILQLTVNISNALADIHDAGVIHNNLSPDNIIVDNNGGNVTVKIIGLSSAYLLASRPIGKENNFEKPKDILSLGVILFEMFTGRCPFQRQRGAEASSEEDRENERLLLLSQNQLIYMLTSRVSLVFAKLVLNLMGADGSIWSIQSARDVSKELNSMLVNLGSIMLSSDKHTGLGRLQFPQDRLYGRDSHLSKLMHVCDKIGTPAGPKMVIVSGYSGTGKSSLVRHVKGTLEESRVHFVSGKFDQLKQTELSAIDAAFTEYTNDIIRKGPETILETRDAIIKAIDTDIGVLTQVFPCLRQIIGKPTSAPTKLGPMEAKNRFKFIFQTFVRAVATPSHPIVLFLDDLQWADELSLQLVSTLVADTENSNFLFIGTVRDNELSADHPLVVQINELKKKKLDIVNINIESITKEDVNTLISDTIGMPPQVTQSFSHIVYQKTSGNALLVIQFLQSLWDEGLLLFSLESNTWQWDAEAIDKKQIPDDVGVLMSAKILQLPVEIQHAIKILACFGSKCNESTLKLFMADRDCFEKKHNFVGNEKVAVPVNHEYPALDFAVDEGLLKKERSNYMFAHDRIQHAAYSLIPENEQGRLHCQIGCLLLENVPTDHVSDVLFIAVDQLNRGKEFVHDEDKRVELAKLNLRAGEKAMSLATFSSSASYFKTGMTLLCDGHWKKYYDLSLRLHSLYADVQYCNGHFQEVGQVADSVLRNAKSFHDKFGVYDALIKALGAQYKLQNAIDMCFGVLSQLGVEFPDKATVMGDLMQLTRTIRETSDTEFLNYKEMTDSNIIAAMKFLQSLAFCLVFAKNEYYPMIVAQLLKLTFRYGVCTDSCTGFSGLSYLLCDLKDFNGSDRSGRLSVLLCERYKTQEHKCGVYFVYFGLVRSFTCHIKESFEYLTHGYRSGMQTGEIQYAFISAYNYLTNSFVAGRKLVTLETEIKLFGDQMIEYKQMYVSQMTIPLRHVISNLLSSEGKPLLLGQDKEQKGILAQAIRENSTTMLCQIYIFAGIEAYIFGEYDLAVYLVQKRQETEKQMSRRAMFFGMTDFFDGLVFLAMSHRSDDPKWTLGANNAISNIKQFAEGCPENCEHKLLLLQAEMKSVQGEVEEALIKYQLAIEAAEKNEFIHEQAIANERLADFYVRHSDPKASHHYGKAHSLYLHWGARSKADHLLKNIPF